MYKNFKDLSRKHVGNKKRKEGEQNETEMIPVFLLSSDTMKHEF